MLTTLNVVRRTKKQPMPEPAGYTDDYRVMVFSESGPRLRYLDDLIYTRDEAISVWLTFNGANQRNKSVIVRVGKQCDASEIDLVADGETAIEQRTEYRPLLVIYPTRQEIDAALLKRKCHARMRQRGA